MKNSSSFCEDLSTSRAAEKKESASESESIKGETWSRQVNSFAPAMHPSMYCIYKALHFVSKTGWIGQHRRNEPQSQGILQLHTLSGPLPKPSKHLWMHSWSNGYQICTNTVLLSFNVFNIWRNVLPVDSSFERICDIVYWSLGRYNSQIQIIIYTIEFLV